MLPFLLLTIKEGKKSRTRVLSGAVLLQTSEASWQLVGATPSQLGRQVSSFQMPQQRPPPQGFLGERMKPATSIPTNQTKPVISTVSQAAVSSISNDSGPNVLKVF